MSYQVGIDLGTTFSAAAVCRSGGGPAEVVALGRRSTSVPSTIYIGPAGTVEVGEAAERRALSEPGRVVREFKRRIGDPTPVHLGREPMPADELAARFLSRLVQDVAAGEGAVASRVALTHPAGWGAHKLESLRAALAGRGLRSAVLLPEPQAAAIGYASTTRLEPGAVVAVYDLGGGTFDAAVTRRSAAGFELLGTPVGMDHLVGGVDVDEVVFSHVRGALGSSWDTLDPEDPEVLAAVAGLRRKCTAAKEALSHDTEVLVPVVLPGVCTHVRLGRAEFEEMISPAVRETMASMRLALESAGVAAADLGALLLVGGSSRIPLIAQMVSETFGRSAAVDVDPKAVIAGGAALAARAAEAAGGGRGAATGSARRGRGVGTVDHTARDRAGVGTVAGHAATTGSGPSTGQETGSRAVDPRAAVGGGASRESGPPVADAGRPDRPTFRVAGAGPVPPVVRPPKQARPFTAATDTPPSSRRTAVALVAGVLTLILLGGAVAFGATRFGAGREADARTPQPTTVSAVSPVATAAEVPTTPPTTSSPRPVPPPARAVRPRQQAPAPPATVVPPPPVTTTAVPPPTTVAPAPPDGQNADKAVPGNGAEVPQGADAPGGGRSGGEGQGDGGGDRQDDGRGGGQQGGGGQGGGGPGAGGPAAAGPAAGGPGAGGPAGGADGAVEPAGQGPTGNGLAAPAAGTDT